MLLNLNKFINLKIILQKKIKMQRNKIPKQKEKNLDITI